jgi:hypothetical protein
LVADREPGPAHQGREVDVDGRVAAGFGVGPEIRPGLDGLIVRRFNAACRLWSLEGTGS